MGSPRPGTASWAPGGSRPHPGARAKLLEEKGTGGGREGSSLRGENPTLPDSHLPGTHSRVTAQALGEDLSTFKPIVLHVLKCMLLGARVGNF